MTDFEIGAHVRALPNSYYAGQEGFVAQREGYPNHLGIIFHNLFHRGVYCVSPLDLELIEKPAKRECYIAVWSFDDGFGTIDHATSFASKSEADNYAKALVAGDSLDVAVFKMVSKHSSAVTVTSEDV